MPTLQPPILLVLSNILLMHANNTTYIPSTSPSPIPTIAPTIYFTTDQALSPTVDPMLSLGSIFGVHIIYIFITALTVIICCIACCLLYFVRQSAQIRELLHKQTIELQAVRNLPYNVQSPACAHTSNASIPKYKDNESCSQITAFSSPPSIPSIGASNNSHQNTNNQNTNNHKMYKQRSVHTNTVHVPHNNNMPPPFRQNRSNSTESRSKHIKPFPRAQQTPFNQNIAARPHGSSLDSNTYYISQKSMYSQSNHHQSPRQPALQRPHTMRNRPNPPPQIQIQHRYHPHQNAKQRPMQYPPHSSPTSPPYSVSTQQYSPRQVPIHQTQLQPHPRSVPVPNQRRPIQIIPPHPNSNKMLQNNNNAQQQMQQLQQMQQNNKNLMSVRSVLTDITDASYDSRDTRDTRDSSDSSTGGSDTDSSTDSDVSTSNGQPPSPQQQRFRVNIALPDQGAMDYLHPNSPDAPNSPDLPNSPDSPTNGSRTMVVHEVEEDIEATISVNIVGDNEDSIGL